MKRWLFLFVSVGIMMLCTTAGADPLKVYILAGQSNMVGMASASTLEHIKMTPDSASYYADVFDADGKPVVMDQVYISYGTTGDGELDHGKLGPEQQPVRQDAVPAPLRRSGRPRHVPAERARGFGQAVISADIHTDRCDAADHTGREPVDRRGIAGLAHHARPRRRAGRCLARDLVAPVLHRSAALCALRYAVRLRGHGRDDLWGVQCPAAAI